MLSVRFSLVFIYVSCFLYHKRVFKTSSSFSNRLLRSAASSVAISVTHKSDTSLTKFCGILYHAADFIALCYHFHLFVSFIIEWLKFHSLLQILCELQIEVHRIWIQIRIRTDIRCFFRIR